MTEVIEVKSSEVMLKEHRERYTALTTYVAAVNKRIEPLKKKMAEHANESERHRVLAMDVAKEISEARGGIGWFAIKKEIGMLAKLLGGK